MDEAVVVTISGKVQGVFFRAETLRTAMTYDLNGYVRNMPDGSVQALFQGKKEDIEKMLAWCEKGSPHSRVDRVTLESVQVNLDLAGFDIRY